LMTLKKQKQSSYEMQLVNLKPDVRNVFVLAGFDQLFQL
jgi:anti-anti-sigma regulatory factor